MADESLIRVLKRSVQEWGQRRATGSHARADLTSANLSDLNLRGAILTGANLTDANLAGADLRGAKLMQADLTRAQLSGTDLVGADLREADMQGADLRRANLCFAFLNGANLSDAILGATLLAGAHINCASGLETCIHQGPSVIDKGTLAGFTELPVQFLKGCGLQGWMIEEARLLNPSNSPKEIAEILNNVHRLRTAAPILSTNLFISYSHKDRGFVDHLEYHLRNHGIPYWRDIHNAPAGPLEKIVVSAIRENPTVLLVLSENSVSSDWVEFEAEKARELEKELQRDVLCPISLDDAFSTCKWSDVLRKQIMKKHILPFHGWTHPDDFKDKFALLLKGLNVFYAKES